MSWLRAHRGTPQPDELAELKTENPAAYGLVKALLMKRSLGLLDPKHPTASFAAPAAPATDVPSGPEAFEKIAAESGEKPRVAPLYPEAPVTHSHHNWLAWKPQQSALDDESMVKNVLGAAAEVGAGSHPAQDSGSAVVAPETSSRSAAPLDGATSASSADSKPVASMNQENSYLKGIDFGLGAQPSRAQKSSQENSYLKGTDLGGESAHRHKPSVGLNSVSRSASSANYLASFSWGDEAPVAKAAQQSSALPAGTPGASEAKKKGGAPKDALLAWLSPNGLSPKTVQRVSPTEAPEQNSYLKDLDLLKF